ncbi:DUF4491 family protein [Caproiciproducens sp. NJN-50]|uniref:DUF4491 family protein n=1 Tax=Acutalibacteraceae TaxID=3082771 RepID=UPI000FFE1C9C|nr:MULTISPECIES: DUF4491 family protein [Acutalibacteraceae]QAT49938.1 DUF4491 family protein [Caproiciproducens sp. NJN-50]
MHFDGVWIGVGALLIIGILHPVVIKVEYYFGTRAWLAFLVSGLVCVGISLFLESTLMSSLLSILGFSLFWSIHELFLQKKRVEKGWFPKGPRRGK